MTREEAIKTLPIFKGHCLDTEDNVRSVVMFDVWMRFVLSQTRVLNLWTVETARGHVVNMMGYDYSIGRWIPQPWKYFGVIE